jgi:hypothetical protein
MWYSVIRCIVTLILGLLAVPLAADAQPAGKVWRIGYLTPAFIPRASLFESYRQLGYVDGQKMFQTCGSATLSASGRTINAREGSDDHPSAPLPLLPRKRYCQAWSVA